MQAQSNQCFATADQGVTVRASTNSSAVRTAFADAVNKKSQIVKIAGKCVGTVTTGDTSQLLFVSAAITLSGGYTNTVGGWQTADPVRYPTLLDANSQGRVILATDNIAVQGLILANGDASNNNSSCYRSSCGGVIYSGGSLTLEKSTVISGFAGLYGGGIYAIGTLSVTDSLLVAGNARSGGAIYSENRATVKGSQIENCTARYGGGIYSQQPLTISNSSLVGNSAKYGGGIYAAGSLLLNNVSSELNNSR